MPKSTISDMERRGVLRRLAPGIYTSNLHDPPETVVRRNWVTILGHELPGAVITDRSAPVGGPVGGALYVAVATANRSPVRLPGLTIHRRPGIGSLEGDLPLPSGLYLVSTAEV